MPNALQNCKIVDPNIIAPSHTPGTILGMNEATLLVEPDEGFMIKAEDFTNHSEPSNLPWLNQGFDVDSVVTFANTSEEIDPNVNNGYIEGNKVLVTVYLNFNYVVGDVTDTGDALNHTFEIDISSTKAQEISFANKRIVLCMVESESGKNAGTSYLPGYGMIPANINIVEAAGVTYLAGTQPLTYQAANLSTGLGLSSSSGDSTSQTHEFTSSNFYLDYLHYFSLNIPLDNQYHKIATITISHDSGPYAQSIIDYWFPNVPIDNLVDPFRFFYYSSHHPPSVTQYTFGFPPTLAYNEEDIPTEEIGANMFDSRFQMQNHQWNIVSGFNNDGQQQDYTTGLTFDLYYKEPVDDGEFGDVGVINEGINDFFANAATFGFDMGTYPYDSSLGGWYFHPDRTCYLNAISGPAALDPLNSDTGGDTVPWAVGEVSEVHPSQLVKTKNIVNIKSNFHKHSGSKAEWIIPASGISESDDRSVTVTGDHGAKFSVEFFEKDVKEVLDGSGGLGGKSSGTSNPTDIQLNGGKIPGMPDGEVTIGPSGIYEFTFPEVSAFTVSDGWKEFEMVFTAGSRTTFGSGAINKEGKIELLENSKNNNLKAGATLTNNYYQFPPVSVKLLAADLPVGWSYVSNYNITDVKEYAAIKTSRFGIPLDRVKAAIRFDVRVYKSSSTFSLSSEAIPVYTSNNDLSHYTVDSKLFVPTVDQEANLEDIRIDNVIVHIGNGLFSTDNDYATITGTILISKLGLRAQTFTVGLSKIFNNS